MKMNNFVEFNSFVGELVNFVTINGEIIDFTTNFEENDRFVSKHVSFKVFFGETEYIVYYSDYSDEIDSIFTCSLTEIDESEENTTEFDNKEELLSKISEITLLHCLFK